MTTPKKTSQVLDHLYEVVRPFATQCIGFCILIQQFVRVQFRAVSRKKEQLDTPSMCRHPFINFLGSVHRMAVDNQKHLSFRLLEQPAREFKEHLRTKALLEDHEIESPLVGNGGEHIASEALSSPRDHWCLPPLSVGAACTVIRPQTHLIPPKDSGLLVLGLSSNRRVILFKPLSYRLGISLKGTADRFLGSKVPPGKVPAHCPYRNPDPKSLLNKLTYGFAGPKKKGQLQLFWGTINNRFGNLGSLPWQKRSASRATSSPFSESLFTSFSVGSDPFANSLACHSKNFGYFNLIDPIQNILNRFLTKVRLCNCRKRTSIFNIHARTYSRCRTQMKTILCSG